LILREKPRKEVLKPKDSVKEEGADETEDNEGNQVLSDIHFDRGVNSSKAIDPSLHWDA
jgi:hypothetical protein